MTTEPAPTTVSSPMVTPGFTIAPAPSHTLSAHRDGVRELPVVAAKVGVEGMGGGEQLDAGRDLAVVADGHRGGVEDHAAVVDEGPGPDADAAAVVAPERGLYDGPVADVPEQLLQQAPALAGLGMGGGVEALDQALGARVGRDQVRIVGEAVQLAAQHALLLFTHAGIVASAADPAQAHVAQAGR